MKRIIYILCVSSLFFVLSCKGKVSSNKGSLDSFVPEKWMQANGTNLTDVQPWLKDFNDAELENVVSLAIKNNYDLKIAASRMNAAFLMVNQTNSKRIPKANIKLDYNNSYRPNSDSNNGIESNGLNLNIIWELDIWGRLKDLKQAEMFKFFATEADYNAVRLSLAINVSKFWFNAIEKKNQINLLEKTIESYSKNLEIISDAYDQGLLTELDIRLARSDLKRAENNIIVKKGEFEKAVRAIEVLMGKYPETSLNIPLVLSNIKRDVPIGLPSSLLKRRPDILAAELRMKEYGKRYKFTGKNRLPTFSLTGRAGTSSSDLIKLLDLDNLVLSIAAGLIQPIFEGGKLMTDREIALLKKDEKLSEYSKTVLNAFLEVEDALSNEIFLVLQEKKSDQIMEELKRAENLALQEYLEGLKGITTYLDTQRRTFDAKSSLIVITNKRIQNRLDLYLALGGDFN